VKDSCAVLKPGRLLPLINIEIEQFAAASCGTRKRDRSRPPRHVWRDRLRFNTCRASFLTGDSKKGPGGDPPGPGMTTMRGR
jgi:hypothetical protein